MVWKGKVAVFSKPGEPLQIREEITPDPTSEQIVVRMLMAGVCGSDAHRLSGDIRIPTAPICFGHEAVGVIEALGSEMTTDRVGQPLAVGDTLYWLPSTPCGTCRACNVSNQLQCKSLNWPVAAGGPNAAGFREYATLSERCTFIRVPEHTSPESVIAFGCAMPTALRGFSKLHALGSESDIVIQGSGPVGLASVVLAKAAGVRSIVVIGDPLHRLEVATALGATATLSLSDTSVEERSKSVMKTTGGEGAIAVIEAAGAPAAFQEGFDLLGMNGQYLILGLYSGSAITPIDPVRINNLNLQIIGSLGIAISSYLETVNIAAKYGESMGFAKLVTHRFQLQDIEKAILGVARGESVKTVIVP